LSDCVAIGSAGFQFDDDGCSIPVSGGDIDPASDGLFPVTIDDGQARFKLLYAAPQCQLKIAFQPECLVCSAMPAEIRKIARELVSRALELIYFYVTPLPTRSL
jgi:hypothetical protein